MPVAPSSVIQTDILKAGAPGRNLVAGAIEQTPEPFVVQRTEAFPTASLTDLPTPRPPEPQTKSADWYRNGNSAYQLGEENGVVNPRTFDEFANDEEPASIRVYGKEPKDKEFKDFIPAYTKFFLDTVSEAHNERSQIIETFGDFYVFFFGERPPVYNFGGTLINTKNASWANDFRFMYDQYLRGTKCVSVNAKIIITYGGRQIEGFILNSSMNRQASLEGGVGFQFQIVVTEDRGLKYSDDLGFVADNGLTVGRDEKIIQILESITGLSGGGTSNAGVSSAQGITKSVIGGGAAAKASALIA